MNETPETQPRPVERDALASLRLSTTDLQALARQGFVAMEHRQGHGPYFKLRWRADGRQKVRYLGTDHQRAQAIRALLDELQQPRRDQRQLAGLRKVRRHLQRVKSVLAPRARAEGYHYHGYTRRRCRVVPHEGVSEWTSGDSEGSVKVLDLTEDPRGLSPVLLDVLAVLREAKRPMSRTLILEALAKQGKLWSERSVAGYPAQLVQDCTLENIQEGKQPGYRIPEGER